MPDPNIPAPSPSLAQQQAQTTPPNAPVPATIQAPINIPQGSPQAVPVASPSQAILGSGSQLTPQQRNIAHSTVVGHGFKSLMSMLSPEDPNAPVSPTRRFFSSILSGAIAGGAAGSENRENTAGSGWSAAGIGAGAAQKQQQQAYLLAQQQKQQEFENNLKTQQANEESQMRKAQIVMYNMQKLKDMAAIQGGDYTSHKELVDDAKPKIASYDATGLKPVKENVSETEYENLKDTPGWSSYDWQPVGMTHYVDKNTGLINYQTVWNAYDPQGGKITLTPSMWSQWKDNGLLDREPNLAGVLRPDQNGNRSIPYSAFMTYDAESSKLKSDAKTKAADAFQTKKNQYDLEHLAAQTAQERATAAASGDEAALRTFELKQERSATDAETALTKSGGDWSKLTPIQKVALQPKIDADIAGYRTELSDPLLKEQLSSNDPDIVKEAQKRAATLQTQLDDARSHSIFVPPPPPTPKTPPSGPDSPSKLLIGKMQQDDKIQPGTPEAYEYITNSGLKPVDQQVALRDSKTPIPWIQATRAADQLIAKTPMSREAALRKVIQQAQAQGITVADRPTGGSVFSPYPSLSSSNITASAAQ